MADKGRRTNAMASQPFFNHSSYFLTFLEHTGAPYFLDAEPLENYDACRLGYMGTGEQ